MDEATKVARREGRQLSEGDIMMIVFVLSYRPNLMPNPILPIPFHLHREA
jgi:hypothetical protein